MSHPKSKINQDSFDTVRLLINAGVKTGKITQLTGISSATISYIRRSETIEQYRQMIEDVKIRNHPKQSTPVKTTLEPSGQAPTTVLIELKELVSKVNTLTAENIKLTTRVDEMLGAYRWVLEHAQMDTKKKRFW